MLRSRIVAEDELYQLLCSLVEQYEAEHHVLSPTATPQEILRELMLANCTPQAKIVEILGSSALASMVLFGKRAISKNQAKRLGEFYHIAEERAEGILLRPAIASALEMYDDVRAAGFLLSNATDAEDYEAAHAEVKEMGLDPDAIVHRKPE